jgi:hypothetical protein
VKCLVLRSMTVTNKPFEEAYDISDSSYLCLEILCERELNKIMKIMASLKIFKQR